MSDAESSQQTATLTIEQADETSSHSTKPAGGQVAGYLQQAIAHHQAGQLPDAERLYRAILQAQPNHPDANHNLGVLAVQVKQPAVGLPHFKAALEANPNQGQYWLSYIDALIQAGQADAARQLLAQGKQRGLQGAAVEALAGRLEEPSGSAPSPQEIDTLASLFAAGKYTEAATLAQTLTERFPLHGFGWKILGAVFQQTGRNADALESKQKAAALSPNDAGAHYNLGNAFKVLGRLAEAEACYRRALQLNPGYAEAHDNLGSTLKELGRLDEAEASYRQALQIKPDYAEAHNNLSVTLQGLGRPDEAAASCRRALQIKPDFTEAHNNLGNILKELGRLSEAEASYHCALQIKPDYAEAHNNLGNILQELGRLTEAEASYRRALEIEPDYAAAHNNLLFTHNYLFSQSDALLLAEARRFGDLAARRARPHTNWNNAPESERRLRVGLVSGDLRTHPVGYFVEGVLAALASDASSQLELIGYPTHFQTDALTKRVKACCHGWHSTMGLADEALAQRIHADNIDILIDLSGHTSHNRLTMFAWKPAPVQVSWLGYFATTGVAAIDYLIADPWTLPQMEEAYFTEKIWRLPQTRLCFTPPDREVKVTSLPALTNGYVTFGCFNNLAKMNDEVVTLWSRVLTSVPNSRLFLKAKQLKDDAVRQHTIERYAAHGINADRLILERSESRARYLAAYQRVDIALDPFPYPGGTTSVESLWMGVPVLTLAGERFLSRQGVGILMNAGLPEWIATDPDDYVARTVSHAEDLQRLATLRNGLRQQVLASPIMDAPRFARHFEAALRGMWQIWCAKHL